MDDLSKARYSLAGEPVTESKYEVLLLKFHIRFYRVEGLGQRFDTHLYNNKNSRFISNNFDKVRKCFE